MPPSRATAATAIAAVCSLLMSACASDGALPARAAAEARPTVDTADLLITNGRIVDGTGNSWFRGQVAVRDGKVVAVGRLDGMRATRTLDARGMIVAPGFIDVHAHVELGLFETPTADNYIQDGVTTVITGNCGGSADSLKEFFARIDRDRTSVNVASLVGHNTVRRLVMGLANRPATADEMKKMEDLVAEAMRDGAVGLSTGLIYLPGVYSDTPEVVALARVAARGHGVYASHIRSEGNKVAEAIDEAIDVGRQARLPVEISHFKVSAPANWGRSRETLALVEKARAEGLDVTIDQYPYTASSTNLGVVLPDWALADGSGALRQRLADPAQKKRIVDEMKAQGRANKREGYGYAVVARHAADPSLNGKSITEIARSKGRAPGVDGEIETIFELMLAGNAQMIYHGMAEDDVRHIMKYPFNMVGADGGVQNGKGLPHPRSYGTNARVLGKYVREEKVIPLEEAVRRMTSLAAQKFQLADRGLLRPGYAADIVIFDDAAIADRATFDNPHQFPAGIPYVVVNGRLVVDQGRHNGTRSGQALKGPAYAAQR